MRWLTFCPRCWRPCTTRDFRTVFARDRICSRCDPRAAAAHDHPDHESTDRDDCGLCQCYDRSRGIYPTVKPVVGPPLCPACGERCQVSTFATRDQREICICRACGMEGARNLFEPEGLGEREI